jgi:hypothetical protein
MPITELFAVMNLCRDIYFTSRHEKGASFLKRLMLLHDFRISVSSCYAQRDCRPGLVFLKSPVFPPSLLKLLRSSLDTWLAAYGLRLGLAPKGLFGEAFCPYRLPAVAPCQRFPDAGAEPLLVRRKGRAGSSPVIICCGMVWPIKRSMLWSESTSLDDAKEMAMPVAPARPVRPMRCT